VRVTGVQPESPAGTRLQTSRRDARSISEKWSVCGESLAQRPKAVLISGKKDCLTSTVNVRIFKKIADMPVVADKTIDCLGLFCPMPIVKTREALRHMEAGQVLEMTSDDPGSVADMKSWSARTGNELVEMQRHGAVFRFFVRKTR
jgi:tRNA 2-thiouridine synthesizing protein A